jgi:hypothetical protein
MPRLTLRYARYALAALRFAPELLASTDGVATVLLWLASLAACAAERRSRRRRPQTTA